MAQPLVVPGPAWLAQRSEATGQQVQGGPHGPVSFVAVICYVLVQSLQADDALLSTGRNT